MLLIDRTEKAQREFQERFGSAFAESEEQKVNPKAVVIDNIEDEPAARVIQFQNFYIGLKENSDRRPCILQLH